jgi:rSAM/selenodomain-associated transferase 2
LTTGVSRTISAVIPTLNEAAELSATIERLGAVPEISQIIVADGGSDDGTQSLAINLGCEMVNTPRSRGMQMRLGAQMARADIVLLLHADTWLTPNAGRAISNCLSKPGVIGGGCYKVFREPSWLMRGSRLKCALRFHLFGRFMGDQAIFVRRDVLEAVGGVPDVPLMEEFELCRLLRKAGRLALAPTVVSTSARRFKQNGVLRTYLRMWRVTLEYHRGTSPDKLKRIYEKQ